MTYLLESRKTKNHPKLRKLAEILVEYFSNEENKQRQSKVIVFSQFRDSAKEIKHYLDHKTDNLVKADIFVGQNNNGLNQRMQAALIKKFKEGNCNTLVATCVAEEGLDIGDVNLIISYDCLSSPIRMV
jgi:ERCC4-related helicase